MIVEEGKKAIAAMIAEHFTKMSLGDGTDDTSSSQTTLDHEVTSKATATTTVVNKQIIYNVEFLGSDISSSSIGELGLFGNTSHNSNSDSTTFENDLLTRINFNSVGPFAAGDRVAFSLVLVVE
tara:strand:- start:485 stop:856 length:372 start_codon:yes stop_codon:yes gene_type:complete